jgi:outer membrane lipopolysaccharide assembly protein LptE/RlpB
MKQIRFFTMAAIITGLISVVAGCGYHFEGGGYINEGVTRVAVEVFKNKSSETNAGIIFTNEFIREILEKTDTSVVDSARASNRILGTVNSITFSTLSRISAEEVVERQVTAMVDVQLVSADGKVLWSVKNFSSKESYAVEDETVNDEINKREAVDTIAQRISERVISQMKSNF